MFLEINWIQNRNINKSKFYLSCAFWFLIALLQFIQDYISHLLNRHQFVIWESLSYKSFWLLFIPFTFLLEYLLKKSKTTRKAVEFVISGLMAVVISLFHLLAFAFLLYVLSKLIHQNNFWSLSSLITEKLSNYLYIALSIYLALSAFFILFKFKKSKEKEDRINVENTLRIKNGKNLIIVDISDIKWIGSDGAYLDIYTSNQKHVVLDSLKNIINQLPENFKRIHKSTIVNINSIKKLKSRGNGDYDIILKDMRVLRLSRNYTKPLKGNLL